MTYDELLLKILDILPNAEVIEDGDGQLVISTGLKMDGDNVVPFEDE